MCDHRLAATLMQPPLYPLNPEPLCVATGWLPWALLLHCCFGLWMYTYFPLEDNDSLSAAVLAGGSTLVSYLSSGTMKDVSRDNIAVRITQANGLPMLFVTILVAAYLVWR